LLLGLLRLRVGLVLKVARFVIHVVNLNLLNEAAAFVRGKLDSTALTSNFSECLATLSIDGTFSFIAATGLRGQSDVSTLTSNVSKNITLLIVVCLPVPGPATLNCSICSCLCVPGMCIGLVEVGTKCLLIAPSECVEFATLGLEDRLQVCKVVVDAMIATAVSCRLSESEAQRRELAVLTFTRTGTATELEPKSIDGAS